MLACFGLSLDQVQPVSSPGSRCVCSPRLHNPMLQLPKAFIILLQLAPKADTNIAGSTAEWTKELPEKLFSSKKYHNPFKLTQNNIVVSTDLSLPHYVFYLKFNRAKGSRAAQGSGHCQEGGRGQARHWYRPGALTWAFHTSARCLEGVFLSGGYDTVNSAKLGTGEKQVQRKYLLLDQQMVGKDTFSCTSFSSDLKKQYTVFAPLFLLPCLHFKKSQVHPNTD